MSSVASPISTTSNNATDSSQLRHSNTTTSTRKTAGSSRLSKQNGNGTTKTSGGRSQRLINTTPAWARHDPPSPPQSPPFRPVTNGNQTWPKDSRGAAAPNLASPSHDDADVNERPLSSTSDSSEETEETGPSRFWSFTLPSKYRSKMSDNHLRRHSEEANDDGVSNEKQLKRQRSQTSSCSSEVNQNGADASGRGRRGSGTTYAGALADAVMSLASSAYMGRGISSAAEASKTDEKQDNDRTYSWHEGMSKVKDEEKGQVSPTFETGVRDREGGNEEWTEDDNSPLGPSYVRTHRSRRTRMEDMKPGPVMQEDFSRHQPLTPGWESPWHPEARGRHSIEIGKYRFNHFGEGGYFPRSDTKQSQQSHKKLRHGYRRTKKRYREPSKGMTPANQSSQRKPSNTSMLAWWRNFLLHNAFVPLLFRLINIVFTISTLAIAIKLYMILRSQDAEDSVGSSPVVAIIFAPLTLVHVGVQIWLEYFSRPIGLWGVGNKLFYTLIELIFIAFWSAELSLSFDNYFTSTLVCTTFDSPYAKEGSHDNSIPGGEQVLNDPSQKPYICRLQGALIGLVFTSLLAYIIVFTVSLFRIFVRASKH